MYLEGTTIKALIELKFNLEEGVAHLSSADKGLSIMCCRGCTSAEMERIWECEVTLLATENTWQLDELLRMSKGVTRAPVDNFWEVKLNVATFMSLVWALFGSEFNYYKGLCNIYGVLDLKEVMVQKQAFTARHCHRITWAIINNGRAYFDDVKTTLDFRQPYKPVFPQSYLIDILKNVWYATPVERSNFPKEWKQKAKPVNDDHGACTSGTGTGQQRGGKRLTQGTGQAPTTPQRDTGAGQGYHGGGVQGQFGAFLHGQWGQHPGGPYPMGYHHEGQLQPGGHTATCDWHTGWDDQRHPKIKDMMHNYLVCTNGCVHLAEIFDAAGKRQNDLPTLPKCSSIILCWSSVLEKCTFRDCRYRKDGGHPLPGDITDEFTNQPIDAINKGIIALSGHQGGSPSKKVKGNHGNLQV
jgi:hypothetical protein